MWRKRAERVLLAISGGMRQRITAAGFFYSVATGTVGAVAFLTGNNLLFLILAVLLAALMVSGFVSRLSLAGLELDVEFPRHVTARSPTHAEMRLRNDKTWMPSFSIHVSGVRNSAYSSRIYFPLLGGHSTVGAPVEVTFARRGLHTENSFQLESSFPFGFASRRVVLTLRRDVLVYPSLEPSVDAAMALRRLTGELEAYARGHGHDFYRIRPYEALESSRHVDWKATAHTGDLQVREFAREQEPLVEIYFDLAAPRGAPAWFEQAVEGCAYLCWELARRGGRLRLLAGQFDRRIPEEGDVYTILEFLALVTPESGVRAGKGQGTTRAIAGPLQDDSVQVLFAADPSRAVEAGWNRAHIVDLRGYVAGPAATADRAR